MSGLREDGLTRLGSRIRHHRQQLGLTLVEVAGQAGISQPFLSQIERGKAAPSMSTLEGLAHALGTTQAHLLEAVDAVDQPPGRPTTTGPAASGGDGTTADAATTAADAATTAADAATTAGGVTSTQVDIRRASEGAILTRAEGTVGGHTRLLPGGPNDTQFLEFVETNHVPGRFFEHPGREWIYVTRGTVLLEVGGSHSRLEPGDVARYDGTLPHRWYVPEGGTACLIVVRPG